jgi:hypothetical protein
MPYLDPIIFLYKNVLETPRPEILDVSEFVPLGEELLAVFPFIHQMFGDWS